MKIALIILCLGAMAHADTWTVKGHTFTSKAAVIRFIAISGNQRAQVEHTQCEYLSNSYTLRKCPKNRSAIANMPFDPSVKPAQLDEGLTDNQIGHGK